LLTLPVVLLYKFSVNFWLGMSAEVRRMYAANGSRSIPKVWCSLKKYVEQFSRVRESGKKLRGALFYKVCWRVFSKSLGANRKSATLASRNFHMGAQEMQKSSGQL